MNTTPIKRNKNLVPLSKDHHDGLLIAWKIRQGARLNIPANRIAAYVTNAFATHLQPHFREEEELLFAKLPQDDELRAKAEDDHAAIRKLAAALASANEQDMEKLHQFADLLEAHIRFEERALFPALEKTIDEDDLSAVGAILAHNHEGKSCETWADEFWLKK